MISRGAEIARHLGELHVSGWRVLNQIDIVLALVSGAVGSVSVLSITGRASGAGRLIADGGALAVVLCAYRALLPPGPPDLLHTASGVYLALGGSVAVLAGGLFAGGEARVQREAARPSWPIDTRPGWTASASVPPPAGSVAPPRS